MRPRRVRCRALDHRVPNENRITDSEIFAADFRLRVEGDADCDVCTSGRHWNTDRAGRRAPPKVSLVPVSRMPDGCDNVASEISEAVTAQ
jgi:hypothetical protein